MKMSEFCFTEYEYGILFKMSLSIWSIWKLTPKYYSKICLIAGVTHSFNYNVLQNLLRQFSFKGNFSTHIMDYSIQTFGVCSLSLFVTKIVDREHMFSKHTSEFNYCCTIICLEQ